MDAPHPSGRFQHARRLDIEPAAARSAADAEGAAAATIGKRTEVEMLLESEAHHARGPSRLPAPLRDAIATEPGAPLPDASAWSRRLGADLSSARVVTGAKAQAAAASIDVAAFTVGERVFLGAGVTTAHEDVMRHELVHVAQQRGAAMPALDELELTAPGDHVEQEARGELDAPAGARIAATGRVQVAAYGVLGQMGPRGDLAILAPTSPQLDAFKYFERHGRRHFAELRARLLGAPTLETGSPYAAWASGRASTFTYALAGELLAHLPARPWDLLEETLAPASISRLVELGRDAANPDDPAQANEYQLGVTLEIEKAYRERLCEALARLVPRVVHEWNRRTLADQAARAKVAQTPASERPEATYPGTDILLSHPIDRYVLAALSVEGFPLLRPDFAAYRQAFPDEGRAGRAPASSGLRPVQFEWQAPQQARRWIRVTQPLDARPEEVANELFGTSQLTYLVTAAAPLFGFEIQQHSFVPRYEREFSTFAKSQGVAPADEVLSGPLADEAALNQAAGLAAPKVSPAVVAQGLELLVHQLRSIAADAAAWITADQPLAAAIARAETRAQKLAAAGHAESDRWSAHVLEQLSIANDCKRGVEIVGALFRANPEAREGRELAWEIGRRYVDAAARSDLVATAQQELDRANQRLLALPADWVEAQFRWIRRAILASRKDARTGREDPFVTKLAVEEAKLRLDLARVREKLLSEPLAAGTELERITQRLQRLATGTAAARNIDACNETFVALKEAKSATGWIRSLASNPVTGDHGNDRLAALAARAERFQAEWDDILALWRSGAQDEAAKRLEAKSSSEAWRRFFSEVAKEIKDQARYDAWMTFGILVGIAVVTGVAGALLEPVAAAAVGPLLGFIVTAGSEAALFTAMSYFLVERHPSLRGFAAELGKNAAVFGILKGVGKGWSALERLLGVQLKPGEVIAQFATLNGIALYEAHRDKAKRGEALTEAEILKLSFDNLVFVIAVALGGKAVAPALGRWRLRGKVGHELARVEALHREVAALAEQAKTTKDRTAAEQLLERQRALLEAERRFLDGLLELTRKGWDHARKLGMTGEQFDAVAAAEQSVAEASRGLREAEIMSTLEPVTHGQYLCEPGKAFDEARAHYLADPQNQLAETTGAGGLRSVEVRLPDGATLRISERAGRPGELTTPPRRVATPAGEPPPPSPEAVAASYGIAPAQAPAFEALYRKDARHLLEWLDALRTSPKLADRLLAELGEAAPAHVRPLREGMLSLHGELEISVTKLGELEQPGDLAKLARVCEHRGPAAEYQYFESSSDTGGKPAARLRFKSRLDSTTTVVVKNILDSLGIKPGEPRSRIFEGMTNAETIRLWDLSQERGYKEPALRKQAADWAFDQGKGGGPPTVREFVAAFQFYEANAVKESTRLLDNAKADHAAELARQATERGRPLTEAESKAVTRAITAKHLGRALNDIAKAARSDALERVLELRAQVKTGPDGRSTTHGREAADLAWKMNMDAQTGTDAAGTKRVDIKSDTELPAHIRSIGKTLSFGNAADGAYHAHKHISEVSSSKDPATETTTYLQKAREFAHRNEGRTRHNQDGSRSVVAIANKQRLIVHVSVDGNAAISTFGKTK